MIALILGVALALITAGVDARAIRYPFKAPFQTLQVGVFDGLIPDPSMAGSGTMSGIGFPTDSAFPLVTGSSLILPTSTGSSPTFPTASGSTPEIATPAPPGFFVSLPYYTVTMTQTLTLVQTPTATPTLPAPASNSSSTSIAASVIAPSGNDTSGNAYTMIGNGPISLPATIVIVPVSTTPVSIVPLPATSLSTFPLPITAQSIGPPGSTSQSILPLPTTSVLATLLNLDPNIPSIVQSAFGSQSSVPSALVPTGMSQPLPLNGTGSVASYPTPVPSADPGLTPTTTPSVSSTISVSTETPSVSSTMPVSTETSSPSGSSGMPPPFIPPYGNSSSSMVPTPVGYLLASPIGTGIPTFTTETATVTTTDTAILTWTSILPITTIIPQPETPQQGTPQPGTLQQGTPRPGDSMSGPIPLGAPEVSGNPPQRVPRPEVPQPGAYQQGTPLVDTPLETPSQRIPHSENGQKGGFHPDVSQQGYPRPYNSPRGAA